MTHLPSGRLLLGSHGGLYASENGGRTWEKVDATGELESTDFMSLVPDPTHPDTLFAGGHGLGVVKSTDGGETWSHSGDGIDGTDIHALAINQRQSEYLFAYSTGHGVYRSSDGGASWDRLDDGPENPGVRSFAYMAVQTEMDRSMGSDNWGLLFAGTADGIYDSFSCFCGWRSTTDEFDGATVYALATVQADLRTMYAGTTNGLWKSTDEGKTWDRVEDVTGRVAAVAIDPADPRTVTAVTERGEVFGSTDGGRGWDKRN
ncbi:MAG: WD40/YVTN/BNR-like repeat-containing protein [Acidimicrobiia bacterium]